MKKRMLWMIVAVVLVMGLVFGFKAFQGIMMGKFMGKMMGAPQTVASMKAAFQDWQPALNAVGSLRAVNGADLSAEVAGIVESVPFEPGAEVEKGAVLVQLRAEDDIARLHALEAAAKLAEITMARDTKQLKAEAISRATVDADAAALDSAKAQAEQQRAIVEKKTIRAPFAGRLGIRLVDVGQYLTPGTPVVTLQQLDPIYADFTLPEQAFPKVAVGQKVRVTADAYLGTLFEGSVMTINSKVAEQTRNIAVRATFANPDHKLVPGMFARLAIENGKAEKYLTLPQAAITYNPYGNTVYLVDRTDADKPVAKQSFVTLGPTRGDQVAVLTGVKEGDEVVTAGQMKIRNGAPVAIKNDLQPTNDPNPKPEDK